MTVNTKLSIHNLNFSFFLGIYRKDERIKDLERINEKTNADKTTALEFAKEQEIKKDAWIKLVNRHEKT